MERIKQIFPTISQFTSPQRLLLLDFWSESEEVRGRDDLIRRMPNVLAELRDGVNHQRVICTEQNIYELPRLLLQGSFDGVLLLPPLGRDSGTADIFSALRKRQHTARQQSSPTLPLLADLEQDDADQELSQFWINAFRPMLRSRDLTALLVTMLLTSMLEASPLIVIATTSMLSGGYSSQLRETIQETAALRLVLELGCDWPGLHRQLSMAAIIMEAGRSDSPLVRMFKLPPGQDVDISQVKTDLQRLYRQEGGSTRYGYVVRNGLPASGSWLVEAHHPRWEQYLNELRAIGEVKPISELGSLSRAMVMPGRLSPQPSEWPAMQARQITAAGVVDLYAGEDGRFWAEEPRIEDRLQPGDVVIREIWAPNDVSRTLRFAVVPDIAQPLYLGPNMARFRFAEDIAPNVRRYVLAYLHSVEAGEWLASRTSGNHLTIGLLRELPVPIPHESVLEAFERLHHMRDQFSQWAQQLQDTEDRLFSFPTLRAAREELLTVSARAQQRITAAKNTETLSWRIRNLYPHPLAFRWRALEILEGGEKYPALLDAAEICLSYLGVIALVLRESLGDDYAFNSLAAQVDQWRLRPGNGVAFGTWTSILEEVTGPRFQDLNLTHPFFEVTQLYRRDETLKDVIMSLKAKRDAFSHGRRPSELDLEDSLPAAESEVAALFENVDFLSQYPLRAIGSAHRLPRQQRGTYICHDLVGDHPVAMIRKVEFTGETPAVGLHLVDQTGIPHLAEPWLTRWPCSKCRHEETYVIDRYMTDGTIMYKSLEYGHEYDGSGLREALTRLGIELPQVG